MTGTDQENIMIGMNYKLLELEEKGTPIYAGIVGAGQMGRGMVAQMLSMKGMRPAVLADVVVDNANMTAAEPPPRKRVPGY
jgi:predicted homoserine dehydrogenase-like protein